MIYKLNTEPRINEDGTRITLVDSTGNVGETTYIKDINTDTYNPVVNSTGYGAPNALRNTLAFFIVGSLGSTSGSKSVNFDSYSHTASEFSAVIDGDGVYSFRLVAVPILEDWDVVELGTLAFDPVESKIFRQELEDRVEVEPSELTGALYSSEVVEFPILINAGRLFTSLVSKRVELHADKCSEREITACTKAIDDVETSIYAATYQFAKGNKLEAIKIIELLNNKDYSHILKS